MSMNGAVRNRPRGRSASLRSLGEPLFYFKVAGRTLPVFDVDIRRLSGYLDGAYRYIGNSRTAGGYAVFGLGGKRGRVVLVHRLLWQSRNPHLQIPEGFEIDHINFDLDDMSPDNLRCIPKILNRTRQNQKHGQSHHSAKLSDSQLDEIRNAYRSGGVSQSKLASSYGVSAAHIHAVVHNRTRPEVN
jgi:HNH endonuclease/helix-turn-helix, Psq domain